MNTATTDAREQFNRQAENYAVSVPHSRGDSLQILAEWAALGRYRVALDIATGPGFAAFAVAPYCETVIASDIAERMLSQARQIADKRKIKNIRFKTINAQSLPYPDASIDLVTCRTAAHHFPDIPKFLSEVHRVLKIEGVFLLCDTTTSESPGQARWHQRVEAIRDPSHIHAPAPSEWCRLITQSGFQITHQKATKVNMTFRHWVKRSGSPDNTIQTLHQDFKKAPKDIIDEYGIRTLENQDFAFHWPLFICRATKL